MNKKPSVAQINGVRYDVSAKLPAGNNIDGFTRTRFPLSLGRQSRRRAKAVKKPLGHTGANVKHPAQKVHSRTQKTKTLMRKAVRRPAAPKIFQKGDLLKPRTVSNPARAFRAMYIGRNAKVQRFGILSSATKSSKRSAQKAVSGEVIKAKQPEAIRGASAAAVPTLPSLVTSVSHRRLERMLDEALTRADSHKQALKALSSHRRWSRMSRLQRWIAGITLFLLVSAAVGYFAWQNIPSVSMKIASLRAKVNASVPAYTPSGYKFNGPIKYENGSVTLQYTNGDASKKYSITQHASNWDSASMTANSGQHSQVQTSQVKGTTVYIFGDTKNAAWVNHGIHYTVEGADELDSDQILKIVESLK